MYSRLHIMIYLSAVDDLVPDLPLGVVLQDLHDTDPTQEICAQIMQTLYDFHSQAA